MVGRAMGRQLFACHTTSTTSGGPRRPAPIGRRSAPWGAAETACPNEDRRGRRQPDRPGSPPDARRHRPHRDAATAVRRLRRATCNHPLPGATGSTEPILAAARELVGAAAPVIDRRGLTLMSGSQCACRRGRRPVVELLRRASDLFAVDRTRRPGAGTLRQCGADPPVCSSAATRNGGADIAGLTGTQAVPIRQPPSGQVLMIRSAGTSWSKAPAARRKSSCPGACVVGVDREMATDLQGQFDQPRRRVIGTRT